MSISWQTGEPPCGEVLVMQYEFMGKTYTRIARCRDGKNGVLKWQELPSCHIIGCPATRWSTLDDDRAAMAMGSLEKMLSDEPWPWFCLDTTMGSNMFEASLYTDDGGTRKVEAPTLTEAIEKLTENGNDSR